MHQAPSVDYPLGKTQALRRWVAMVWTLVIAIDVFWLVQAPWPDWKLLAGLALTGLAGALTYRFCPTSGSGVLHWNESVWSYREGEREIAGLVTVHLDLQSALLVFWAPVSGAGSWHWLSSAAQPSRWLALRRAVFASDRTTQPEGNSAQADLMARP